MHFGFALKLSDIDLWNIDLLDTHLDLLSPDKYTDIPSKYFVCLHNIFKTFSRHVFKTSLRHVFQTSSRHVFKTSSRHAFKTSSRHVFKTSSRRLQRNNFSSSKMSLQDVFKTSSRPTDVCWEVSYNLLSSCKFCLQVDILPSFQLNLVILMVCNMTILTGSLVGTLYASA